MKHEIRDAGEAYDLIGDILADLTGSQEIGYNMHCGLLNSADESLIDGVRRTTDELVEPLQLNANKKVLDVGCGLGFPAIQVYEKYGCDIIGISLSRKQIEIANDVAKQRNLSQKIHFLTMNGEDMGFSDETFDAVYALESLFHMNKQLALREIFRVLKKQGRFSLSDFYAMENFNQKEAEPLKATLSANFPTIKNYEELLKNAGFSDIKIEDWTDRAILSLSTWKKFLSQKAKKIRPDEKVFFVLDNLKKVSELVVEKKLGYVKISCQKK